MASTEKPPRATSLPTPDAQAYAAAVVLFHTHPSADPTPSSADLLFTRRLAYAATLVGVELVDHLVVAGIGRWVSIKAQGGW